MAKRLEKSTKNSVKRTSSKCPINLQERIASYPGEIFDCALHAALSRITGFISPAAFSLAWMDWFLHLAICPARQLDLMQLALKNWEKLFIYLQNFNQDHKIEPCIACRHDDHRFQNPAWKAFPFNIYSQSFMLLEQWWGECTYNIPGMENHHRHFVSFFGRQLLDMFSPSNYAWTNPEVLAVTQKEYGKNFIRGYKNFIEDAYRFQTNSAPVGTENFQVGKEVGITAGKVIYRNRLIELIQYQPTTATVYPEPILIVPAWIMKYYILDLSPHNSMVKYLVEQGHTVFMISWKNPTREDRDLSLEDYVNLGILEALQAINSIIPQQKIHATGYCLGGTLLMIAAAAMASNKDNRLKTLSLFAAQIDFRDAGEILLFVDQSQINYLEDIMWEKGYLDGAQMSGAFSMLHASDLIWSRIIINYLLGKREPINDLMAWDADTTRMPYKMHSQYLQNLFLDNDLVQGRFEVNGKKVLLVDIIVPIFTVSTVSDHIAPWQSVYKIHYFTNTSVNFVLTNGGHNAGIISEPGHPHRSFKMLEHSETDNHLTPEEWELSAKEHEGSWWPSWSKWLAKRSGKKIKPPHVGASKKGYPILCDAPGTYVLEK